MIGRLKKMAVHEPTKHVLAFTSHTLLRPGVMRGMGFFCYSFNASQNCSKESGKTMWRGGCAVGRFATGSKRLVCARVCVCVCACACARVSVCALPFASVVALRRVEALCQVIVLVAGTLVI